MRQIWLSDGTTEKALDGSAGILAMGISGLGANVARSIGEIGDGFFMPTSQKSYPMQSIMFDLEFRGTAPYDSYQAFADWILTAERLILRYKPSSASQKYSRDVLLELMTKGELTRGRYLVLPVRLQCVTPWYTVSTLTGTGSVSVPAGGQLGTSVKVTTTSALTNPVLNMTDADGEFQRLSLNVTKPAGTVLEYSNHYYDSHIYIGTDDAIQYADLSTAIFGHSKKAFTLALSGAEMNIEVRRWWRTV